MFESCKLNCVYYVKLGPELFILKKILTKIYFYHFYINMIFFGNTERKYRKVEPKNLVT